MLTAWPNGVRRMPGQELQAGRLEATASSRMPERPLKNGLANRSYGLVKRVRPAALGNVFFVPDNAAGASDNVKIAPCDGPAGPSCKGQA